MFSNKISLSKFLLTTTSTCMLMVGGASEVFGVNARQVEDSNVAILSTGAGLDGGKAFVSGSTLEMGGERSVYVNIPDVSILAIDTHGFNGRLIISENATIGSVVDLSNTDDFIATINITYNNNLAVTFTGTGSGDIGFFSRVASINKAEDDYSALGSINFNGHEASLVLNDGQTISSAIDDKTGEKHGILVFRGGGGVNAEIGTMGINLVQVAGAGVVNLGNGHTVNTRFLEIGHDNAKIIADGLIIADAIFTAGGSMYLGAGLDGNINFANNPGLVLLGEGQEITGMVTGTNGTFQFLGSGVVKGGIGDNKHKIQQVIISGEQKAIINTDIFAETINIDSSADVIIDGIIDVTKIEFLGGNKVIFEEDSLAAGQTMNFAVTSEVITNNYNLAGAIVTNRTSGGDFTADSRLTVNIDQVITGQIGESIVNPFGTLDVVGACDININTDKLFAGITGSGANVIFNHIDSSASFLGKDGENIAAVSFITDSIVHGSIYANRIDMQDGVMITFKGEVFEGKALTMQGTDSKATFDTFVTVNTPIIAANSGDGNINFKDGADIKFDIGTDGNKVGGVQITGDIGNISADIHADTINIESGINLTDSATLDGTTTFNGATINLGEHDLTLEGETAYFTEATIIRTAANNSGSLYQSP